MLGNLLRFELKYHFRQITFKIAAIVFFALGMLAVHGRFGGDEVYKNAPYVNTYIVGFLSVFSIFVSTLFSVNVVMRDTTSRMEQILYTTSVTRFQHFLVRFAGLFLSVSLILSLTPAGLFIGSFLVPKPDLGPFSVASYLQPLFAFGLPNVLFAGSTIFCAALLTRNARAVHATGVLLYILYLTASILGNSALFANSSHKIAESNVLSYLIDPFGLSAFFGTTRLWTDLQLNTIIFPLHGLFLLNRILWSALSLAILATTYRFFHFRLTQTAGQTKQKTSKNLVKNARYSRYQVFPQGVAYFWASFKSQSRLELISLFKHIPFMVMLLLWIFVFTVELRDSLFHGAYGVYSYPTTGVFVNELRSMRPALLLIVFYSAEILWREYSDNMHGLIYSSPVRYATLWAAKCVALGGLIAVLVTVNIGIGVAMQVMKGHFSFEWPLYFSLYYYSGAPFLLFSILFVFIQTMVPNKYLGMLLSMLAAAFIVFADKFGIEHYLLRYATVPDLKYSDINGFGHYARAFNWYMLYWALAAVIMSFLSVGFWQNGWSENWMQRVRSLRVTIGKQAGYVLADVAILWISTGFYIYYQTNVTGNYKHSLTRQNWKIHYEKKYKHLSDLPQPVIQSVNTVVDLFPEEARYTVKGRYVLKNEHEKAISRIWVGMDSEVTSAHVSLPGAEKSEEDAEFGQHWFDLKNPLLPGEETTMEFDLEVIRSGFVPFNSENAVVSNGTYIELEKYVPFLGYNSRFETDNLRARGKHGLPAPAPELSGDLRYHLIDFETTISAPKDQNVVTVGTLTNTRTEHNRKFFTYKTSAPIGFMFALSSARYLVKTERYRGVALKICYQPGQEANLPAILRGMKDALDYCQANFAPYPLKQLTIAEIPHYKGAATAYPGLVFSAENYNFQSDYRDSSKIDQSYAITVHEVSHQWWANMLSPAHQPGYRFLTESLAKYTESMVMEKHFGKMYLRNYLLADRQLYFALGNSQGKELPVQEAFDQPFVYYQKGGLAMYAIRENLGEERVNAALRRLLEKHRYPGPKAKAGDLLQELGLDANPAERRQMDDLLKKVIVYDLKLKVLSEKPLANGRFEVKILVETQKKEHGTGKSLLPDEYFDIAVFGEAQDDWNRQTKPLYLEKHHFTQTKTTLTLLLDQKPKAIAIDPYGYVLDEDGSDNISAL